MRILTVLYVLITVSLSGNAQQNPELLANGFKFTEGPAMNQDGILYFSDVPARRIYTFDPDRGATVFLENSGGINGLYFAPDGTLTACSGKEVRAIVEIDPEGNKSIVATEYQGKKFNSPNDLWLDSNGGIYFTDPRYGNRDNMEMEEHVYYISPDHQDITRIISDLVRPNGIVGSRDGKKLFVVDQGEQKTYVYKISKAGVLKNKKLFAACGIDGISVGDNQDVFITCEKSLKHFDKKGKLIHSYSFDAHPTNVHYANGKAYVTTQAGELFQIEIAP